MKKIIIAAAAVLALATACKKEESRPMTPYETADAQAAAYDFQIYPKAEFLPQLTELFRKAHFVLHPGAASAPPMAAYQCDASVKEVAEWYAQKYGYPKVADNQVNNFSSVPPQAFYRTGDLHEDAVGGQPIFEKLQVRADVSKAVGQYQGAHVNAKGNYPRITIQRPFFDVSKSLTVDKTLIILVKE